MATWISAYCPFPVDESVSFLCVLRKVKELLGYSLIICWPKLHLQTCWACAGCYDQVVISEQCLLWVTGCYCVLFSNSARDTGLWLGDKGGKTFWIYWIVCWVCLARFWQQGDARVVSVSRCQKLLPMSNRDNASQLQDRAATGQGQAHHWQWYHTSEIT